MRYREFGSAFVSELNEICTFIVVETRRLWIEEINRVLEKQPRGDDERDNNCISDTDAQPVVIVGALGTDPGRVFDEIIANYSGTRPAKRRR